MITRAKNCGSAKHIFGNKHSITCCVFQFQKTIQPSISFANMRVVGKRKRNKLRMEWMSFDIFRQTQPFLSVSKYNQPFNRQQFEKRNEPQQKQRTARIFDCRLFPRYFPPSTPSTPDGYVITKMGGGC